MESVPRASPLAHRIKFSASAERNYVLGGSIENTIGNDSALSCLILGQNKLTGELPPSIANARNLQILNVMDNSMTGPIPRGIGEIRSLRSLFLSDNSFSGKYLPACRNLH